MSAFIAVAFEDRVELLTDGAICDDETGHLIGVKRKVWHSSRVPLAVTGRGQSGAVDFICAAIVAAADGLGGFDATMAWLIDLLAERHEIGAEAKAEIVIVGIAESAGPVVLYFNTEEGQILDGKPVEPWTLIDMAGEAIGGSEIEVDPALMEGLAFVVSGSMAMEAMRKTKTSGLFPYREEKRHSIGGFIDHTVVSPNCIEVQRIHEWPDLIGEPIDPFRATAAAA